MVENRVLINFRLVPNEPQFWNFIRKLRNDPRVQHGFIQQGKITKKQQKKYMVKHNDEYYVCLINIVKDGLIELNVIVGFVGSVDGDIRVAVHPDFHGQGLGVFMINKLMELHPDSFAKVKLENTASLNLFLKAGFKPKFFILEK